MSKMRSVLSILVVALVSSCSAKTCQINGDVVNPSPNADVVSPDTFTVRFDTDILVNGKESPIVMEVTRAWAPLGADRFYSLVKDGFYNQAAFFRVVPDFVLQFGISGSPAETSKWNTIIPDDPVIVSNTNWTVTYATAGPDTRTSQLFFNYIDNSRLDASGFAPFGKIVSGFETALAVVNPTPEDSNGIDQDKYTELGNPWILKNYPTVNMITCAEIV